MCSFSKQLNQTRQRSSEQKMVKKRRGYQKRSLWALDPVHTAVGLSPWFIHRPIWRRRDGLWGGGVWNNPSPPKWGQNAETGSISMQLTSYSVNQLWGKNSKKKKHVHVADFLIDHFSRKIFHLQLETRMQADDINGMLVNLVADVILCDTIWFTCPDPSLMSVIR